MSQNHKPFFKDGNTMRMLYKSMRGGLFYIIALVIFLTHCTEQNQPGVYEDEAFKGRSQSVTSFYPNGNKKKEIKYDSNSNIDSIKGWYEDGILKYAHKIFKMDTVYEVDSLRDEVAEIIKVDRIGKTFYRSGTMMSEIITDSISGNAIVNRYSEDGDLESSEILNK
jgi:antitoxin component YwqK of YwqJK toxin-antitoxin module